MGWVKVHSRCTSQKQSRPTSLAAKAVVFSVGGACYRAYHEADACISSPFPPMFRFFSLWERHDNHKTQGELAVLREANVVGMTTTGVAMHQSLVEALGAKVVVVEEAAEVP